MDRGSKKRALAEKDAELRQAVQEREALARKLGQMEKFIIRGGTGSPAQVNSGMRRMHAVMGRSQWLGGSMMI